MADDLGDYMYHKVRDENGLNTQDIVTGRDLTSIELAVDSYYKGFLFDHMYQFRDYFSDKYKIRRKLANEQIKKSSIKEISSVLNQIVTNCKSLNEYDGNVLPEFNGINLNSNVFKLNEYYTIKDSYGEIIPGMFFYMTV